VCVWLVSAAYSYLQAGLIESAVCVAVYVLVFLDNGMPFSWLMKQGINYANAGSPMTLTRPGTSPSALTVT
jgi:hypothetical protein